MPFSDRVRTRAFTWLQTIIRADPDHQREAAVQREYEFSNGRVFDGRYRERGAYGDDD